MIYIIIIIIIYLFIENFDFLFCIFVQITSYDERCGLICGSNAEVLRCRQMILGQELTF